MWLGKRGKLGRNLKINMLLSTKMINLNPRRVTEEKKCEYFKVERVQKSGSF